MAVLYLASDEEGAGKTTLCATLARRMEQGGRKTAIFKPVAGEGLGADSDTDVQSFHKLLDQRAEGWPIDLPKRGLTAKPLREIRAAFDRVSEGADHVLVEGSCALSLEQTGELADSLDARVLVVFRYRPDLSASEFKRWEAVGNSLLGFVINGLTLHLGTEARTRLLPSLESEGLVCFGVIPEDRRLLGVSVRQLAKHLDGRFVACEEKADTLVDHLMVGGMGMDPCELYLGERSNKAVIVRGDRPDVQMPALNSLTSCMVLTKGIEPIEYVKYEAEQEEVSLMVVETDTLDTMEALNSLMASARFDHPLKLRRYIELLEQNVDLPGLFGGLGLEE